MKTFLHIITIVPTGKRIQEKISCFEFYVSFFIIMKPTIICIFIIRTQYSISVFYRLEKKHEGKVWPCREKTYPLTLTVDILEIVRILESYYYVFCFSHWIIRYL